MEEVPDIVIFIGRFHPLFVHLPIGFLLLAVIFDFTSSRFLLPVKTIRFTWLLGALSAAVAAGLGYMLSLSGDYNDDTLAWHMWSGIILAILSILYYFLRGLVRLFQNPTATWSYYSLLSLILLMLLVTGHLGGSLTHGSEYLIEYAPAPIQKLVGSSSERFEERPPVTSLDSADIFADAIIPILRSKCTSCHNRDKRKGRLLLTSYDNMLAGGDDGPAIVPGSLDSSQLYRRITLPEDHKEFMPAEGKRPLTEDQLTIIEWWISNQAPPKAKIASLSPDENITKVFERYFGLGSKSLDQLIVPPADTTIVNSLRRQGFLVHRLSGSSNLLEAVLRKGATTKADFTSMPGITDQLVWLQLGESNLTDKDLEVIGTLTNLRKLNISKNAVGDEGARWLLSLVNLEYLNLYETNVSDSIVSKLVTLPALKELYLWRTKVTTPFVDSLIRKHTNVKIIYQDPVE